MYALDKHAVGVYLRVSLSSSYALSICIVFVYAICHIRPMATPSLLVLLILMCRLAAYKVARSQGRKVAFAS